MIFSHGAGGTYANALKLDGVPSQGAIVRRLVDEGGRTLLSPDAGGPQGWGSDLVITRLGQAATWLRDPARTVDPLGSAIALNVSDEPVVLIGVSMGGLNVLNYAKANPEDVAAIVLIIPVLDPEFVRANNVGGAAAAIDAAYGGSYVDATERADHSPAYWGPSRPADWPPTQVWFASDDPWCPLATCEAFGQTPNTTLRNVGALGHDEDALAAVNVDDVLAFIAQATGE